MPASVQKIEAAVRRVASLLTQGTFPVQQEGLVYHCPLTASKRRNLALQLVNRGLLRFREVALPHILHVGVTTLCNLQCPACPTGTEALGRPGEHLDFDTYRRAVDELRGALLFMLFWDWGEPLLHPRLPEMIGHARASEILTVVSTNGNIAAGRFERLVEAGPTVVIVCIDGADQQTYEKYRVAGCLEKALAAVTLLARLREQSHSAYPVIEFRSLATRDTETQLPELLRLARDSGADLFSVKSLRPYDYRKTNLDHQFVPLSTELSRYTYGRTADPSPKNRLDFVRRGPLRCAKPLYSPALNADGTLAFCSYASHAREFFGDVSRKGFLDVWRGRFARDIRREFVRRAGSSSCVTCYFRSDHKPTILHQVPLRPFPPAVSVLWPKSAGEFLRAVESTRDRWSNAGTYTPARP